MAAAPTTAAGLSYIHDQSALLVPVCANEAWARWTGGSKNTRAAPDWDGRAAAAGTPVPTVPHRIGTGRVAAVYRNSRADSAASDRDGRVPSEEHPCR